MKPSPDFKRRSRTADLCLILFFFALLWLPTADSFLHLDSAPTPNEKRLLSAFPEWNQPVTSVKAYLAGVEAWFNDHFGFRKRLIRLHHKWSRELFNESSFSEVIVGRDGWLFYGGGRMIDNHRGTRLFSGEELREWQKLIETRRDWLARRGIGYLFVVAPNKETIYPEQLPDWLATPGAARKLDQFFGHMQAHSTVEVLDLRSALIEARRTGLVYLQADSHWNARGAFAAYQELIRALGRYLPGLEPLPLNAFEQTPGDITGGDLAEMLGQEQRERGVISLMPKPPLPPVEVLDDTTMDTTAFTRERRPRSTARPDQQHRIVFFRDSFANAWLRLLGHHFSRALYVWQPHWNASVIDRERPAIVVDQVLERYLNERDPRELRELDALPK